MADTESTTAQAKELIESLWSPMVQKEEFRSGGTWEYLNQQGEPGLSLFTSLAHPWSSAPTYLFPEYVGGIRAMEPGFRRWEIKPGFRGWELEWVRCRVKTGFGTLSVGWRLDGGKRLVVEIDAPGGTTGSFKLPHGETLGLYLVDGRRVVNRVKEEAIEIGEGKTRLVVWV